MNIDILGQWCVYNDYPIYRYLFGKKYRDQINKIILYPSRHHGAVDLEDFAKRVFPVTWVDPVPIDYGVEDWRQAETTPLLTHSTSEWIWFSEQDFFVDNWDKFFDDVAAAMQTTDAIGWWNETAFPYLHPCCFFIKREVFEETQKDFRAHPEIPGADHFAMLTRDLERLNARFAKFQDLGWENWKNAFHLGGLTYPYQNWKGNGTDIFGVGNVPAFFAYNNLSRAVANEYDPAYLQLSHDIERELFKRYPGIYNEAQQWEGFFRV